MIEDLTLEIIYLFQADFATSAVDFLHRVGRSGRAGQFGLVTSLYSESNRDLVAAVRQAEELGQPVVILETCNLILKDVISVNGQILCYLGPDFEEQPMILQFSFFPLKLCCLMGCWILRNVQFGGSYNSH